METCKENNFRTVDSTSPNFSQFKAAVDNMTNGLAIASAAGVGSALLTCGVGVMSLAGSCLVGVFVGLGTFGITFIATLIVWTGDAKRAMESMSVQQRPDRTYTASHPRRGNSR